MKKRNTELMVGLLMVLGFGCFAVVAVRFGGSPFFSDEGIELKASFQSVSGLKAGSPIEIAGVPVGKVKSIALNQGLALVTLAINRGVEAIVTSPVSFSGANSANFCATSPPNDHPTNTHWSGSWFTMD